MGGLSALVFVVTHRQHHSNNTNVDNLPTLPPSITTHHRRPLVFLGSLFNLPTLPPTITTHHRRPLVFLDLFCTSLLSLKMAQTNNHAGIIHARDGYCDIMVRGNKALSNGRSEVAIPLYTKILYILSPGDVCAFLNRSIAYVHEGYSELAVIDAHRASLAAKEMYNVRVF